MGLYLGDKVVRLPVEYQEVEWIQSSGNCRIDTGVQTNGTYFKIDTKINFLSFSSDTSYPYIFGPVDGGQCFICYDGSGHIQYGAGNNDIIKDSISANTDYSIIAEWDSGTLTTNLNGSSATDTYSGGLSTHDIPIFCRRRNSSIGYNCYSTNLKIYYFKMYSSSNTLVRDLVPCYRVSDNVIGMYDLVNDVFYTNQGTGMFTKGPNVSFYKGFKEIAIGKQALPATYQEVEYIQNSGTQYIDTGYEPNNLTNVVAKFNIVSGGNSRISLYGAMNTASGASRRSYILQLQPNDNYLRATAYSNTGSYAKQIKSTNAISTNTDYIVEHSNTNFIINGTSQGTFAGVSTYNVGYNMYIFSVDEGGTSIQQAEMKLYSFKITENDTLIRDLVPCYRKADDVIGLYDLVNGVFYTNQGTGTFTKGSDVPSSTRTLDFKKIYVGSQKVRPAWQPGANTLLYLPLESDVVDMSGQATTRVFSTNSLTYTTVGGVPSVHIGSTGGIKLTTPYPLVPKTDTYPCTVSILVYTTNTNTYRYILDMAATNGNRQSIGFDTTNKLSMSVYNDTNDSSYATLQATPTLSQWNHIVYTITTTSSKLYVNGVLVDSGVGNPNYPRGNRPYTHDKTQGIFCTRDSSYTRGLDGNARELIFEKTEWTEQEVASYYTWIKSKLGI